MKLLSLALLVASTSAAALEARGGDYDYKCPTVTTTAYSYYTNYVTVTKTDISYVTTTATAYVTGHGGGMD
ncbi:uncharacterized protein Z519_03082 [Cladophialophora bantiana CBS 173.52]|uniref:Uncharacterized protein n=1 Tax=Cladophialophora bantiana (strain ATCC 10958 / CBS 173.52 / CDC B-1940 / NIH 8579) TaxID=1442370 RepID=A0A0D2F1I4_CLAB1|nr:uncharacterized protein Z519_03082 [Cladophialophora bantiana CBS 173.52]KIW96016.1 hypothetical protein Z519_03082 [Cladophialophora bantiana CBS 173.52]